MRWESLQFEHYGIYQDEALGRFTEDPVRLVHFLHAKKGERAVDLGTGNGIVPLYANALYGCAFTGVDVDEAQLHLGRLSAERNGQSIPFVALDVSEAPKVLGHGRFDLVTMNPPYYSETSAGEDPQRARQRHGDRLDDFLAAAFQLLNNGGRLCLCYRADGMADLFEWLRKNRLEPKRMELVPRGGRVKLILVEAKKLAKPGMDVFVAQGQDKGIT